MSSPLDGLAMATPRTGRNQNLNDAYQPPWDQSDAMQPYNGMASMIPQGDTRFDPFEGTQWGRWLDTMGASDPGGAHIGGAKRKGDPMAGLHAAAPQSAFTMDPFQNPLGTVKNGPF